MQSREGCPLCSCRWLPGNGPTPTTAPVSSSRAPAGSTRRVTTTHHPATTTAANSGGGEWSLFNGLQYRFFAKELAFRDAEAACVVRGGHLASVTSTEELVHVFRLYGADASRSVWIGGMRASSGAAFAWTDRSAWQFARWADREPDAGTVQGCVFVGHPDKGAGSRWFNGSCDRPLPFVCERKIAP